MTQAPTRTHAPAPVETAPSREQLLECHKLVLELAVECGCPPYDEAGRVDVPRVRQALGERLRPTSPAPPPDLIVRGADAPKPSGGGAASFPAGVAIAVGDRFTVNAIEFTVVGYVARNRAFPVVAVDGIGTRRFFRIHHVLAHLGRDPRRHAEGEIWRRFGIDIRGRGGVEYVDDRGESARYHPIGVGSGARPILLEGLNGARQLRVTPLLLQKLLIQQQQRACAVAPCEG